MSEHVGTEIDEYRQGYQQGQADHAQGVNLGEREKVKTWAGASERWKEGWTHGYEDAAQDATDVNAYDIEVTDVTVAFQTGVSQDGQVMTLGDAANIAAINLMRVGLDGYDVLYTDEPTGRQWIGKNGVFMAVRPDGTIETEEPDGPGAAE